MLRVRYAPVVAIWWLGGGCEPVVYAAHRVAGQELYRSGGSVGPVVSLPRSRTNAGQCTLSDLPFLTKRFTAAGTGALESRQPWLSAGHRRRQ